MITAEPCSGRGCKIRDKCDLYDELGDTTHGFWHSDDGFVCEEYQKKNDPVVDLGDDQEELPF